MGRMGRDTEQDRIDQANTQSTDLLFGMQEL